MEVNFQTLYWCSVAGAACDMRGYKDEYRYSSGISDSRRRGGAGRPEHGEGQKERQNPAVRHRLHGLWRTLCGRNL